MLAPVSCVQVASCGSKISGMVATHPPQSISPAVTSMRPSGSAVTVGYQRPTAIGATRDQARVAGLKRFVSGSPMWAPLCPPATSTLPSGSRQWPAQNMLVRLFGTEVNAPVAGFQRRAWLPKACPSQDRISPVASKFVCTATIGQATGAAHLPEVDPVGVPTVTGTEALVVLLPAKS